MSGRTGDGPLRLILDSIGALGPVRRPLVVGEASGALARALMPSGAKPHVWLREAAEGASIPPRACPEGDGFDAALIRLPKSKDALLLALHAAAAKMVPGGMIVVFGANAEGIRSVAPRLSEVADVVETLATGHHARVLIGRRRSAIDGLKGRLADWRHEGRITLGGSSRPWVSYPGAFAKGGLDDGTAFLIEHLPRLKPGARVLDFAAGTGVIAAALTAANIALDIDMIDADAIALVAAAENVPTARSMPGTSLAAVTGRRYDLIVSNPPIHEGILESHKVLERLIADAPAHLRDDGTLLLVVQRRVAVLPLMRKAFPAARIVADNGRFTIVSAERADRAGQTPLS